MGYKILAINPGSTSTKIALYEDECEIVVKTLDHPVDEIEKYNKIVEQFQMRKDVVISFLEDNGYDITSLDAVVGRGGMLPPVKSGAYQVFNMNENNKMRVVSCLGDSTFNSSTFTESYIYDGFPIELAIS